MINLLEWIEVRFLTSVVLTLVCWPFAVFFLDLFVMPFKKAKALEKAKQDGHEVEATLIKRNDIFGNSSDGDSRNKTYLKYEYFYNNKRYIYRIRTSSHVSADYKKKLYFKRKPAKARTEATFGRVENKWGIFCVLFLFFAVFSLAA